MGPVCGLNAFLTLNVTTAQYYFVPYIHLVPFIALLAISVIFLITSVVYLCFGIRIGYRTDPSSLLFLNVALIVHILFPLVPCQSYPACKAIGMSLALLLSSATKPVVSVAWCFDIAEPFCRLYYLVVSNYCAFHFFESFRSILSLF